MYCWHLPWSRSTEGKVFPTSFSEQRISSSEQRISVSEQRISDSEQRISHSEQRISHSEQRISQLWLVWSKWFHERGIFDVLHVTMCMVLLIQSWILMAQPCHTFTSAMQGSSKLSSSKVCTWWWIVMVSTWNESIQKSCMLKTVVYEYSLSLQLECSTLWFNTTQLFTSNDQSVEGARQHCCFNIWSYFGWLWQILRWALSMLVWTGPQSHVFSGLSCSFELVWRLCLAINLHVQSVSGHASIEFLANSFQT